MEIREKGNKTTEKGASMNISQQQLFDTIKEEAFDVWRGL